jgi:hypothetical protein
MGWNIQQTAKLLKCLLNCLLIVEATQHSTIWTTSGLEVSTQHPHALSILLHRKTHSKSVNNEIELLLPTIVFVWGFFETLKLKWNHICIICQRKKLLSKMQVFFEWMYVFSD